MSLVIVPVLVVLAIVFIYALIQTFKMPNHRVKQPTKWELYLERERRKQEERDRET